MSKIVKEKVENYTMKLRLYPSKEQTEKIEKMFRALHLAYNMTFHEVFQKNPAVCEEPNEEGLIWPDFNKMANKIWKNELIRRNPEIGEAVATSITNIGGIFLRDAKRAWDKGMHKLPVNKVKREDFRFYCAKKPRCSFLVQVELKDIVASKDNAKVIRIKLPKIKGFIKARGFNRKIWFGSNGNYTFEEAVRQRLLAGKLTVQVSKDNCGDYYISITMSKGKNNQREIYREKRTQENIAPVGLDVGIKDIAILNDGTKYENKHFKKQKDKSLRRLNRQLSRRWGSSNSSFRDYNREIRKENKNIPEEERKPLAQPSRRYQKTKLRKARLERKIARQREAYYHQITAEIIERSSLIAVETLRVKNMMRNHKLAYALSDVAMSDFIEKLKYKAGRSNVSLIPIGTFEASSQICSQCGAKNPAVKSLGVREWVCPNCGTQHDRDVNAAKNILAIAQKEGGTADKEIKSEKKPQTRAQKPHKPYDNVVFPDKPDIAIRFSKELTRLNDPRYVIVDKSKNTIIDDAQGAGYRSVTNAKNCYKAKMKWAKTS